MAKTWLATATAQELYQVARLHIPESLVAAIPKDEMPDFRYRVARHQYHCMHLAVDLRHNLSMQHEASMTPRDVAGGMAVWYTTFRRRDA